MNDPFEKEVAVFAAARRLSVRERGAYLDETCAGDPGLRRRVEELLQAGEQTEGFLQAPAPGAQRPEENSGLLTLALNLAAPGEKAGDRIGRYKLLQQIGEGGCGLVYMAEQEEPVRRRVALKVIKLGMDTKQVIARFEAERQALAVMDHANIAKVLDAGATETGRPYFVMELVRGIRITDYCDEHKLSTKERLELFMQVCHAVQHAHQKGIIHRDLKPSNILIARPDPDSRGVPKVIDFGIAKATQGRLTDQTLFTAFEQFIGTPAYMSPEQAEFTMQDVDTRTDIYSLGVLLYELLTGKTPFDAQELLASGLDMMRQTIREQEPKRPSTRLSTMLADELTTTAKHHRTDSARLIHSLRGDLDWIVMKALEKERSRRYETASGLANDVKRHLHCEPVSARPPSRLYEFQKTVRRHKFGFGAAAALILALAAGIAVSTSQAIRATRAERQQNQSRQRAELAEKTATEELWHSYLAQARAIRFSGQPGRRFDSLEALRKAAAIRFSPELRDDAIACLALPDLKLSRSIAVNRGVFDCALERYACVLTNSGDISIRSTGDDRELLRLPRPSGAELPSNLGRFSHNGKFLPSWYGEHLLNLWDLERGVAVLSVPATVRFDAVDFSPDDRCLAVPGPGKVTLYALAPGQESRSLPAPIDAGWARFDPSGHKLALSSRVDIRLPILDADSGKALLILTNAEGLSEIAWHPRSPILAAAGWNGGLIYLWDIVTGRQIRALKRHQNELGNVAFSPDGDMVISSGWDGTRLWHRTGEPVLVYLNSGELGSFGPGRYGHSVFVSGSLELLSFAPGSEARQFRLNEEDRTHKHLAFSTDGRWLALAAGEAVELFDASTAELLVTLSTGPVEGVCFQQKGDGLIVSGERGLFRWPIRSNADADELSLGPPEMVGSPGAWQQARLSQNGQVFAAFHGDHAQIFDATSMREIARTGPCSNPSPYRYIAVSPDGSRIATSGWHAEVVRIWDAHTGSLIKQLAEPDWVPQKSPYPVFVPDGRSLIIADWLKYRVWDTDSWTAGTPVARLGGTVALSHDGTLLATCDEIQTSIQLRDASSGEILAKLQSPIPSLMTKLEFSPDDTQIAVAHSVTRELIVWDLRLLREELKGLGLDWARPPYPPAARPAPKVVHLRVLTNALPSPASGG